MATERIFTSENFKFLLILLCLSCVFFVLGNNVLGLTNPDEVFYAQTAKEMQQRGSWMTPYLFGSPQFEKPILLYWLLRISCMVFGTSAFAWRFFPAIFAAVGTVTLYFLATLLLDDKRKGFVCAIVLMSSGLYIGLARTVYTDMIFSVFILMALTSFWMGYARAGRRGLGFLLSFVFAALAVLTKGPLGLILPLLAVVLFLAIRRELGIYFRWISLVGFLVFLLLAVPWYAFMIHKFGRAFTSEFFYNDHIRRLLEAEHPQNDKWYFYPLSSVVCMFPWSIFVVIAFLNLFTRLAKKTAGPAHLFLACWILAVFVVFQAAHSKLVSYVFPMLPALAIMTGDFLYECGNFKSRSVARGLASAFAITAVLVPVGLAVAFVRYPEYLPPSPWIYVLAPLSLAFSAAVAAMATRGRFRDCIFVMSPILVMLLCFGLSSRNIDSRLSSRNACQYLFQSGLLQRNAGQNRILCSKYFARGVYYYAERDVAVADIGGTDFFSPHPIPYLDSNDKVREFLERQPVTYCVVDESSLNHLRRITAGVARLDVRKKLGNEFVVTIAANQP